METTTVTLSGAISPSPSRATRRKPPQRVSRRQSELTLARERANQVKVREPKLLPSLLQSRARGVLVALQPRRRASKSRPRITAHARRLYRPRRRRQRQRTNHSRSPPAAASARRCPTHPQSRPVPAAQRQRRRRVEQTTTASCLWASSSWNSSRTSLRRTRPPQRQSLQCT
jgi:hypothetical protein